MSASTPQEHFPESDTWYALCGAHMTSDAQGREEALRELSQLLDRRSRGERLPAQDEFPRESELASDNSIAAHWDAYKAAVKSNDLARARQMLDRVRARLSVQ